MQVVFQKALQSASLREIKVDLKVLFIARYKGRGFKLPQVVYKDMCCYDCALLADILNELQEGGHDLVVDGDLPSPPAGPILDLPVDVHSACIPASKDTPVVAAAAQNIRRQAEAHGRVVGLDLGWEISRVGAPGNPPATIQLAAGKQAMIFHILHGQRSSPVKLPSALVDILEDASIMKVGVGNKVNCTRLSNLFCVTVKNVVDFPALALSRNVDLR